ncbi:MAG: cofactor-independent phosphoglycerate mutase [Methanospirillum sp.]
MKVVVLLGDGMADEPLAELGGLTPLEYAETPNMDRVAREGRMGLVATVPDGFEAGSDVANLGLLGYDPALYYTGRGPLEAASMRVALADDDVAYRCNLVTVVDGVMADFSAGHITSAEGASLLASLQPAVPSVRLVPGISYRNLLVAPGGSGDPGTPPHDIAGQPIGAYLPTGPDRELLLACMAAAEEVFAGHPVNRDRIAAGKPPATGIWPWSGGHRPALPLFADRFGVAGGMISAVDLLNGIARYAGLEVIVVPGATGYLDTDYDGKARAVLAALGRLDFVYCHVEAPDEAGHLGSVEEKVRAIECVDGMLGTILDGFAGIVAVLPDHATPLRLKTHTREPVPVAIRGLGTDGTRRFSEREAEKGDLGRLEATALLPLLLGRP